MAEKGKRGFASMDREKQRRIASKGGRVAHEKGRAHQFTREEAREAGRKGGLAAHQRGKAHEFTPEEAREAGRKGGQAARVTSDRREAEQITNQQEAQPQIGEDRSSSAQSEAEMVGVPAC